MNRSTKILIAAVGIAGALLSVGEWNARRLQSKFDDASICDLPDPEQASPDDAASKEARDKALLERYFAAGNKPTDPDIDLAFAEKQRDAELASNAAAQKAACDANVRKAPDEAEIRSARQWPRLLAAIIAILGAMPWAWYFLLRRVAEFRAAVDGRPPSG